MDKYEKVRLGLALAAMLVSGRHRLTVEAAQKALDELQKASETPIGDIIEVTEYVGFGRRQNKKVLRWDQSLPVGSKVYAAPVGESWEPAETAPKNGDTILVYGESLVDPDFNLEGLSFAYYTGMEWLGSVWNSCHDLWECEKIDFTHWRRLPRGPKR